MALSGTFGNTWRKNYRVQLDWTATQNIANNTTTVTAKIYLMSLSSTATITGSSSNKPAYISIDGTEYVHENLNTNLSGNQKKLMATSTKTITHNADGTKSIQIGGSVNVQATLSGVYWFNVAVPTTTVTLDTIPRASTISSFPSFTIGNSFTVGVSRASTAFTHTLMLYHGSTKVGEWTGVTTSKAITLTTAQLNTLYGLVSTSATLTMRCYTYNGTTAIGSYTTATATATVANASTISTFGNFTIGNNISVAISRPLSAFTHTISLYVGSTSVCQRTGIGTSTTLTLSTAENNIIYNALKNAKSGTVTLYCTTYHGTNTVRSQTSKTATATVSSSIVPTFTSVTAAETVTAVSALGVYVQNLSRIKFTINGAQGASYSTISSYKIVFNGVTYNSATATTGAINKSGSITATATITDSRGRTASKTVSVALVAYNSPQLSSVSVIRCNSAGTANPLGTYIKVTSAGGVSSLSSKNTMTYKISTKPRNSSTWTSKESVSLTIPTLSRSGTFSGYPITTSYDVRVELVDKFSTTVHNTAISTGEVPLSYSKTGIGVGKVWEKGSLDVAGEAWFDSIGHTLIPSGANLDDYTKSGFYKNGSTSQVATMSNTPAARAFGMLVLQSNGASQLWFDYGNSYNIFHRVEYQGAWTSWINITDNRPHDHSGANITSGTVPFARLPTGTGSSNVAVGNHSHSYLPLSGGSMHGALNIYQGSSPFRLYGNDTSLYISYYRDGGSRSAYVGHGGAADSFYVVSEKASLNLSGTPVNLSGSAVNANGSPVLTTAGIRTGTFTSTSTAATSVSFSSAMSSVPFVFATYRKTGANVSGDWGSPKIHNVTASGFSCLIGGSNDATARALNYFAISY